MPSTWCSQSVSVALSPPTTRSGPLGRSKLWAGFFDGEACEIRPTPKRAWRLYLAITEILRKPNMSSKQLEDIIGHHTPLSLLRRPLLAAMRAVYAFAQREYRRPRPLWSSVLRELRWMRSLLPIVVCDQRAKVATRVMASDASLDGWGLWSAMRRRAPSRSYSGIASSGASGMSECVPSGRGSRSRMRGWGRTHAARRVSFQRERLCPPFQLCGVDCLTASGPLCLRALGDSESTSQCWKPEQHSQRSLTLLSSGMPRGRSCAVSSTTWP